MKTIVAYVVKCGSFYANGATQWRTTQRRAFFFRWNGKPDDKWATEHAKYLTIERRFPKSMPIGLEKRIRVVAIFRC